MIQKVNIAAAYLNKEGYELKGIKADGNCFCNAFLKSYARLSRKIPILDSQKNKISYLRDVIATKYVFTPEGNTGPGHSRASQIRRDKEWLTTSEGGLLANALSIPIRMITVNKDNYGCGINDMLIFSELGKLYQEWNDIQEKDKPKEYVLIVDLRGHFIYVEPFTSGESGGTSEPILKKKKDQSSKYNPPSLLLKAMTHEFLDQPLLAMEGYLLLSEKNSTNPKQSLNCMEKAESFAKNRKEFYLHFFEKLKDLSSIDDSSSEIFQKRDQIRMTFEESLAKLSSYSKRGENPVCFICCNENEPDVEKWLKEKLVPDLNKGGIQSLFYFEEIRTDRNRRADQEIIVCTPEFKKTYEERKFAPTGVIEQLRIACERYKDPRLFRTISPIYFKGNQETSCPVEILEPISGLQLGNIEASYYEHVFDLIGSIRKIPWKISHSIKEEFLSKAEGIIKGKTLLLNLSSWRNQRETKNNELYKSVVKRISHLTQMVNLPEPPKDFTGRKEELETLLTALQKDKKVAISGLGGMGKTALALKYADEHRLDYQWIHFISGITTDQITVGLLKLADDLYIPKVKKVEERLGLLKVKLSRLEYEYLLIFDGVDLEATMDDLENYLPEKGKCLLLTSRLGKKAERLNFRSIDLTPLKLEEAIEYLLKVAGKEE